LIDVPEARISVANFSEPVNTVTITDPLFQRWIGGHLPVEEINKIRALAEDVFEDKDAALAWLQEPNLATDNNAPIELLGTPDGYARVRNLLLRIEYGVLT